MHALALLILMQGGEFEALLRNPPAVVEQPLEWNEYFTALADTPAPVQVWYVSAPWCVNCPPVMADLKRNGVRFRVGPSSRWRHFNYDKHAAQMQKLGVRALPCVLVMRGDEVLQRYDRYPGFPVLQAALKPHAPRAVGALRLGTLPLKSEAAATLERFRTLIGSQGKVTLQIDRGPDADKTIVLRDGVTLSMPRTLRTEYELKGDALVLRFVGELPVLTAKAGLSFSMAINGITLAATSATLRLDWYPDISVGLTER